ncbi:MAG: hypothetical protein KF774_15145, partial [Planctomyces sp.]|nr:hypothetical protein [Planctomyces sp.]
MTCLRWFASLSALVVFAAILSMGTRAEDPAGKSPPAQANPAQEDDPATADADDEEVDDEEDPEVTGRLPLRLKDFMRLKLKASSQILEGLA